MAFLDRTWDLRSTRRRMKRLQMPLKLLMKAHAAAAEAAKASADASAALNAAFEGVNLTGSEDYLKNVGNFAAAALDPLGIDVKIDIETPEGRKSCQVSSATSSSSSTSSTSENEENKEEDA